MDKLIDRLRGYINHWEARNFDMDRISPHNQTIPITGNEAKDYLRLLEQEQRRESKKQVCGYAEKCARLGGREVCPNDVICPNI